MAGQVHSLRVSRRTLYSLIETLYHRVKRRPVSEPTMLLLLFPMISVSQGAAVPSVYHSRAWSFCLLDECGRFTSASTVPPSSTVSSAPGVPSASVGSSAPAHSGSQRHQNPSDSVRCGVSMCECVCTLLRKLIGLGNAQKAQCVGFRSAGPTLLYTCYLPKQ